MPSNGRKKFIQELQEEKLSLSDSFTRSLDLLATGLFTRQGQFFYELLQNAEDCTASGNETTVEIVLRPESVIFRNDGELFTCEDIKSVCDVGRTQKRTTDENIGFWGIGFKSVFRVTDSPYIISDGFQFKFDREYWQQEEVNEDLEETPWYVTPIWADNPPVNEKDGWNSFYLPYIDEKYKDRVLEGVDNLQNHLLLFLEQISEIRIVDELNDDQDRSRRMQVSSREKVCSGRLVELSTGEKWWVYEKILEVPPEVSDDKITRERKRENIDNRPARIALQVNEDGEIDHLSEGSVHASVFSFLPIQGITSGMPFMIDADLLTGAGRTKPHEDAVWNNWMMEEIGSTLIPSAINRLKQHETWQYQFQNALLPNEKPKSQLFRRLDNAIMDSARELPIIPTKTGGWVRPEDAIHPIPEESDQIREIISNDDTTELTERDLTHKSLQLLTRLYSDRLAIRQLGASPEKLPSSGTNIAEFVQDEEWLSRKRNKETVRWFINLYELLNNTRGYDGEMKDSAIVYADDRLRKPDEVYLKLSDETADVIHQMNAEEVFPTVNKKIVKSSSAKRFLKRLDINKVSAKDLAEDLIKHPEMLPGMATQQEATKWFRDLYTVLSGSGMSDSLSETTIVYTGETVVQPSSDSTSVLLPAKSDRVERLLEAVGRSLEDVDTVPEEIINPEYGGDEVAKNFLRSLGIEQVGPDWIAEEKLLPKLKLDGPESNSVDSQLDPTTLVKYTGIVNEEMESKDLEGEFLVLTQDEEIRPASEVYISLSYGATYDTGLLLDAPVVSSAYSMSQFGANWSSFFQDIGVQSGTTAEALTMALQNISTKKDDVNIKTELAGIYESITEQTGDDIPKTETELLTESDIFKTASSIYLTSGGEARQRFDSKYFVWTPDDGEELDSIINGLHYIGVEHANQHFQKEFYPGSPIEKAIDTGVEERIRSSWKDIADDIPGLNPQPPQLSWIEEVQINYNLGDKTKPATASRRSYLEDGELYLARDFNHRWEDLARTITESTDIDISVGEIATKFVTNTEEAAVSEVVQYEASCGRNAQGVREDQSEHQGYDVISHDPNPNGEERHIEIKSFSQEGTAKLRPNQQVQAKEDDAFYLYIVISPKSDNPKIWFKKNPDIEQVCDLGAEFEKVLTIPRTVWQRYCDGPIPTRQTKQ